MATDAFDPRLTPDDEFATEGMRRRFAARVDDTTRVAPDAVDPYANNWVAQTGRSIGERTLNYAPAVEGLARKLGGDNAGAGEAFERFRQGEERARALGPDIQSFGDAAAAGGSVGDYVKATAYAAAEFVPDMALSLTGAGIGAVAGKSVAGSLARSAARRYIEGTSKTLAKREAAEAAAAAGLREGVDEGAVRVARAQAREAIDRQVVKDAIRLAGRTPRAKLAIEQATTGGRIAGATAGQFPGMTTGDVDVLADENTDQGDALKVAGSTLLASAFGALPVERFLGQFGKKAAKEVPEAAQRFLPRVAKEFGKQGLAEGSTEVLQEVTQRAGHYWVDKNLGLLSPEALDAYLYSFAGGFIAGGALGAGGEVGRAGVDATRDGVDKLRTRLSAFAGQTRDAYRKKYRPGEPMDDAAVEPGVEPDTGAKFQGAIDAVKDAGRYATGKAKSIFDSFTRHNSALGDAQDVEQRVKDLETYAATLREGNPTGLQHIEGDLPVAMPTRLQTALMRSLRPDSDWWGDPEAAQSLGKTLEKVFRGEEMDADDAINLYGVTQGKSGIKQAQIDFWREQGPKFIARSGEIGVEDMLKADERRAPTDERQGDNVSTEGLTTEDDVRTSIEDTDENQDFVPGMGSAGLEPLSAVDQLASTDPSSPQFAALREQAQADLRKGGFVERAGSEAQYNQRLNNPKEGDKYVALREVTGQPRQLLDLGAILSRQRARTREQLSTKQHLMNAFNDMKLAGMPLDLRTLRPGPIRVKSDGTYAELTENDVRELRRIKIERIPGAASLSLLEKDGDRRAALDREYLGDEKQDLRSKHIEDRDGEGLVKVTTKESVERTEKTDDLGPRRGPAGEALEPPPGQSVPGQAGFVPAQSVVSNVSVNEKPGARAERVAGDARRAKYLSALANRIGVNADDIVSIRTKKGKPVQGKLNDSVDAYVVLRNGKSVPTSVKVALAGYDRTLNSKTGKTTLRSGESVASQMAKDPNYKINDAPADKRFEHGVEVGMEQLNKQFPESERNTKLQKLYDRRVATLNDPASGLAMEYHERAVKGEFETASVREQPWDKEEAAKADEDRDTNDRQNKGDQQLHSGPLTSPARVAFNAAGGMFRAMSTSLFMIEESKKSFAAYANSAPADPEANAALAELVATPEGQKKIVQAAKESLSIGRLLRLLGNIAQHHPAENDLYRQVYLATAEMHQKMDTAGYNQVNSTTPETVRQYDERWKAFANLYRNLKSSANEAAMTAHDVIKAAIHMPGTTARQQLMLTALSKSKALKQVLFTVRDGMYYNAESNTLNLDVYGAKGSGIDPITTLIHEATHAMTVRGELVDNKAAKDLEALLKHVRAAAVKQGIPIDMWYGMSDTQEFLAEAFSDRDFQNILRKIPALETKTYKNAWEQFKGIIATLFGFTKTPINATALEEALTLGMHLGAKTYESRVRDTATQAAQDAPYTRDQLPPVPPGGDGGAQPPAGPPTPRFGRHNFDSLVAYMRDKVPPAAKTQLMAVLGRDATHQQLKAFITQLAASAKPPFDPQEHLDSIDAAKDGLENTLAFGYLAWQEKGFKNAAGLDTFHTVTDDMAAMLNVASSADIADRVFTDIASGRIDTKRDYDAYKDEAKNRGTLQTAVTAANRVMAKLDKPLAAFWTSKLKRMWDANVPALREFASLIQRPQGTTGDDGGMTPAVRTMVHQYQMRGVKILGGLSGRDTVVLMDRMQRQLPNPGTNSAVDQAHANVTRMMTDLYMYMQKAGVKVGRVDDFFPVVFDIRNDAVKARLTEMYSRPYFEDIIRDLLPDRSVDRDGNEVTLKSNKPIAELIQNLVEGVTGEPGAPTTGADAPNFKGQNYRLSKFVYDMSTVKDSTTGRPFVDPRTPAQKKKDIKDLAAAQTKDPADIFARYIEPAIRNAEYARRFGGGESGTAKRDALLQKMEAQGATPDDIELAKNALKAALGTYGADGSPTLAALSPALAEKFSGPKSRAVVQGLQAYQNVRLLPLALISSIVDPLGIAVRTGGDFKTAWEGMKVGFQSIWNKETQTEMRDMLSALGSMDDMAVHELLAGRFGDVEGNATANRVNEFVFRWNGMSTLVRTTRYMATISAHAFLLKHADINDAKSKRYLSELGLKPGDISAQWTVPNALTNGRRLVKTLTEAERAALPPSDPAKERDDRVRAALLQFVDESILRPNSQQTPLWHSDPYMGLVAQYKSFLYAIFDQIGGRIQREMKEGNLAVLVPAFAYIPIVIMSEMLRGLIQYGFGGNPQRDEWGPQDYLKLGVDRAGFLGPQYAITTDIAQDVQRNRLPGTSQLGPSVNQGSNILTAFEGHRDLGKEFEAALPASAAWKRWNDENEGSTPVEPAPSPLG